MGDKTGISWTDATWNPIRGCSRVSPGCEHCYAEGVAARFSGEGQPYEGLAKFSAKRLPQWTGDVRFIREHLEDPIRWARPRRIFTNSMSDLFHEELPVKKIAAILGVIALASHHTFQVLTKRPQRALDVLNSLTLDDIVNAAIDEDVVVTSAQSKRIGKLVPPSSPYSAKSSAPLWPLPNLHIGVTAEDQKRADERIPILLKIPATVRFVSVEPQIERVVLREEWLLGAFDRCPDENNPTVPGDGDPCDGCPAIPNDGARGGGARGGDVCGAIRGPKIDWVICGGESGHHARPFDLAWARALRDECGHAGVAFFMKQIGAKPRFDGFDRPHHRYPIRDRAGAEPSEWPADLRIQKFPETRA